MGCGGSVATENTGYQPGGGEDAAQSAGPEVAAPPQVEEVKVEAAAGLGEQVGVMVAEAPPPDDDGVEKLYLPFARKDETAVKKEIDAGDSLGA